MSEEIPDGMPDDLPLATPEDLADRLLKVATRMPLTVIEVVGAIELVKLEVIKQAEEASDE